MRMTDIRHKTKARIITVPAMMTATTQINRPAMVDQGIKEVIKTGMTTTRQIAVNSKGIPVRINIRTGTTEMMEMTTPPTGGMMKEEIKIANSIMREMIVPEIILTTAEINIGSMIPTRKTMGSTSSQIIVNGGTRIQTINEDDSTMIASPIMISRIKGDIIRIEERRINMRTEITEGGKTIT
jgi:hypothetical protein